MRKIWAFHNINISGLPSWRIHKGSEQTPLTMLTDKITHDKCHLSSVSAFLTLFSCILGLEQVRTSNLECWTELCDKYHMYKISLYSIMLPLQ